MAHLSNTATTHRDIQILKGCMRETETDRVWACSKMPMNRLHHLRSKYVHFLYFCCDQLVQALFSTVLNLLLSHITVWIADSSRWLLYFTSMAVACRPSLPLLQYPNCALHTATRFYTDDFFTPMPSLEDDAMPMANLLKARQPHVLTVALDPEGTGPDTHYKVLLVSDGNMLRVLAALCVKLTGIVAGSPLYLSVCALRCFADVTALKLECGADCII
jgi:hypothetical protein